METKKFEKTLKSKNALNINDEYILFRDLELYSFKTEISIQFENYEELYKHKIDNVSIKEIIEAKDSFDFLLDGGRGVNSGSMGGGFNHAGRERGKKADFKRMYSAEFNIGGKNRSYEKTLDRFKEKYAKAEREYGVEVDDAGFVHQHVQGTSTSVYIGASKGNTIIHNHPSGGNFSDTDLISTASDSSKGIVAVGTKKVYSFSKTNKFKSKEFIKAVKKAKWPTKYNYDKGADWWLKKNAKEYGYVYSAK